MAPTENGQGYLGGLQEVERDQGSRLLPHFPLERQTETLSPHSREGQETEITILQVTIHSHIDPPSPSRSRSHRCV